MGVVSQLLNKSEEEIALESERKMGEIKWAVEDTIDWYTRMGRTNIPSFKTTQTLMDNPLTAVYEAYKLGMMRGASNVITK